MVKKINVLLLSLIMSGVLGTSMVSAAKKAPCAKIKKAHCIKRADCKWIKGYKRKSGKVVRGHCKKK